MSKWANEMQPHPGDGTWIVAMPVGAPVRDTAVRRCTRTSPLPGCAACSDSEPCARHASFDLIATIGGES